MADDIIKRGETYGISITALDSDGDAITMDGDWSAASAVTKDRVGGTPIESPTLTIAAGVATGEIDTGSSLYEDGTYYWDARLTDDSGDDYWTTPVKLVLLGRNTPSS